MWYFRTPWTAFLHPTRSDITVAISEVSLSPVSRLSTSTKVFLGRPRLEFPWRGSQTITLLNSLQQSVFHFLGLIRRSSMSYFQWPRCFANWSTNGWIMIENVRYSHRSGFYTSRLPLSKHWGSISCCGFLTEVSERYREIYREIQRQRARDIYIERESKGLLIFKRWALSLESEVLYIFSTIIGWSNSV